MCGGSGLSAGAFSVPIESESGSIFCFDASSSRERVSASLENALIAFNAGPGEPLEIKCQPKS
jgi:hypothetical protein